MKRKQTMNEFKRSLFEIAIAVSLAVVLVFAAQSRALARSGGPGTVAGLRKTGAPGEGTCNDSGCHDSFPLNSGDGSLRLSGVPIAYNPGITYPITVNLSDPGQSRWGFQLTVLDKLNNRAGTLVRTDTRNTQLFEGGGRQYIEHTSAGTFAGTPNASPGWSFDWQAPKPDVGPVTFYVAGNAANNNGTNKGDYIYTITNESLPAPDISVTPTSYDYGNVIVGAFADNTFIVKNEGTGVLNVSDVSLIGTDAGEFSIQSGGEPFSLNPGDIHDIVVRFEPTSVGDKNVALHIESNDPDENPLDVPLTGIGIPPVGAINGTVTDKDTGKPIARALVIAIQQPTKAKALTNEDGYYEISDLSPGDWWVVCIKRGYKAGIAKVEVVAGKTSTQDFELALK